MNYQNKQLALYAEKSDDSDFKRQLKVFCKILNNQDVKKIERDPEMGKYVSDLKKYDMLNEDGTLPERYLNKSGSLENRYVVDAFLELSEKHSVNLA